MAVTVSKAEAAAFLEVLAQTRNLSAVDCAALVEFSSQIQWQQCDANAVLRALCSSDSTPSSGRDHKTERKRRFMQGYTGFLVYFTVSDWNLLLDPKVQQVVKLDKNTRYFAAFAWGSLSDGAYHKTSFQSGVAFKRAARQVEENAFPTETRISPTSEETLSGLSPNRQAASCPPRRAPNRSSRPKTIAPRSLQCWFSKGRANSLQNRHANISAS